MSCELWKAQIAQASLRRNFGVLTSFAGIPFPEIILYRLRLSRAAA
jgi:hypothetical protein